MSKKTPFRSRTGDTLHIHVDPELVFRRALTLSSSRDDVSLQKIMEHPIGPVPTSIFHDDGSMRKSVKAELLHKLEETASSVPVLPDFDKSKTVFIRDGMAIVQTFHVKKSSTFGDLANDYVARALSNYHQSETVIDVFDRRQALCDLYITVKDSLIRSNNTVSGALTILAVCFEISGDKDMAYQCYEEALQCIEYVCPSAESKRLKLLDI
ncbi:Hypothetical predicted protein [Mytilus galloprovincialis]|uniref:Uncharacterized protein n=1 Tax=Mytilus galloprovincialis TaxID=29158 RepID=A0A8B6EHZ6_MYTGA|nr:Hypothetical predicted protein [Mytilus galloprovincialis]